MSTNSADLPSAATASRLSCHPHSTATVTILLATAVVILLLAVFVCLRARRLQGKPRLLAEIMDLADALERELLECRARLREIPALAATSSPAEQLSARSTIAAEPQVQDALRDLLAHRLWLKENAQSASIAELKSARDALASTRIALAAQLVRLADVRAEFEQTRIKLR